MFDFINRRSNKNLREVMQCMQSVYTRSIKNAKYIPHGDWLSAIDDCLRVSIALEDKDNYEESLGYIKDKLWCACLPLRRLAGLH